MENRTKRTRPEYLYTALLLMGAAILLVVLIVCGGCEPDEKPAGESSVQTSSAADSSAEATLPEEDSSREASSQTTPVTFARIEVPTEGKMTGILALTDPAYAAGVTEEPEGLANVYQNKNKYYGLSGNALALRLDAIEALNDMTKAFTEAKGEHTLIIHEAYKSGAEVQDDPIRKDLSGGNTVYFTLYPVDKDGDNIGSGKYMWLVDNCNRFGYILRYPSEKSAVTQVSGYGSGRVYRYVGYEHAAYMAKYHLCLEEYLDLLYSYTPESPLEIEYTDASGNERTCFVYYVSAGEGETATVAIRGGEGVAYSVSGNGSDGFIVTCYQ